jgi:RNA polymerase sigma-70 factor (family 1)
MGERVELDDIELYGLVKSGDEHAFTMLYRRHWKGLFNSAHKRLQCRDRSQDIVQNVFIDLWERRSALEIANLQAFLYTAVRFQVFKFTSRQTEHTQLLQSFEHTLEAMGRADDTVLEGEISNLLALWIEALPEKRREIFLLHCFEGRSTADIAQQLDISQKTVQNQINTATSELRGKFDKILCSGLTAYSIFFQY